MKFINTFLKLCFFVVAITAMCACTNHELITETEETRLEALKDQMRANVDKYLTSTVVTLSEIPDTAAYAIVRDDDDIIAILSEPGSIIVPFVNFTNAVKCFFRFPWW